MTMDNRRPGSARDIDEAERGPDLAGASGGNLQRNIGSKAEAEHNAEGKPGVTRVHGEDRPDKGDRPNLPNR